MWPVNLTEQQADVSCEMLKTAIQNILKDNSCVANDSYLSLFTYTYKLVMVGHGERLYNGLKETLSAYLETKVLADVLDSFNHEFLKTLEQCWLKHQLSMVIIKNVLTYMDKTLVRKRRLVTVYDLGLVLFRDIVVHHVRIKDHLRQTMLSMVMRERSGEVIDRQVLECACHMLMVLGVGKRTVYEEDFEQPYLAQAIEFYKAESPKLLAENNALVFIKAAKACIRKEVELAQNHLDPSTYFYNSTEKKITQVIEDHLIQKNVITIVEMENSGFVFMLKNKRTEDLACMYTLLKNVPNGLKTMTACLSEYLREEGRSLMKKEETDLNPITYIQSLLDLKDRFDFFLNNSFADDYMFKQTISSDFMYFLNSNPRSPEYLSLFIDDKLKRGVCGMDKNNLETVLDKVIIFFRFLQDKDVFETYYKRLLAKRLLFNKSVSDNNEKNVVSKMKAESGYQFTFKLEGMLKDIFLSNFTMNSFKKYLNETPSLNCNNLELSVCVLTNFYWPLPTTTITTTPKCKMPIIAQLAYDKYQNFCLRQKKGQQLWLQPQLGSANIMAVFHETRPDNSVTSVTSSSSSDSIDMSASLNSSTSVNSIGMLPERRYLFHVSTYQMAILMLFNTYEKITMETIMKETEINEQDLTHALQSLTMGKLSHRVLLKSPKTKEIELSHEFSVNESYTSKKFQVNIISTKTKSESEPERQKTKEKVEADRINKIDAALMYIMEDKKRLMQSKLIIEVTDHLRSHFMPSPVLIRNRLECLFERGDLIHTREDRNIYNHVM